MTPDPPNPFDSEQPTRIRPSMTPATPNSVDNEQSARIRPSSSDANQKPPSVIPGFLAFVSGQYSGTILPLKPDLTRIGRDGRINDHVIDDPTVSDVHLSIRFRNGVFILTDMDSENGTKVNGQPVDQVQLAANDEILIGRTRFVLMQVPIPTDDPG